MSAPNPLRRQRLALIGLALLFLAPVLLAFYVYYGLHWHPVRGVNHGTLIQPPRPIPELSLPRLAPRAGPAATSGGGAHSDLFKGKWTLLYLGPAECADACRAALLSSRQVRALLREDDRVQRVFLAQGEPDDLDFFRAQQADLIVVRQTQAAAPLLALLKLTAEDDPAVAGRTYIVDPLCNVMMWYAPGASPNGMLEDLKRLLGLSHVG